jgi:hypothetical protein
MENDFGLHTHPDTKDPDVTDDACYCRDCGDELDPESVDGLCSRCYKKLPDEEDVE